MLTNPFGLTFSPDLSSGGTSDAASAAFAAAVINDKPEGKVETDHVLSGKHAAILAGDLAEPVEGAASDAVTREDGIKLDPATVKALQNANLDPAKATTQEIIDFLNTGNRKLFERAQSEKKVRQSIEAEKAELEKLLKGVSLDGADKAEATKAMAEIQTKVSRLSGLEMNLVAAAEHGLIATEALEAIRTASPESANTIFKLMAQVQSQSAQGVAVRAAGVGTTVTQPTKEPAAVDDFSLTPNTPEYKAASEFVAGLNARREVGVSKNTL